MSQIEWHNEQYEAAKISNNSSKTIQLIWYPPDNGFFKEGKENKIILPGEELKLNPYSFSSWSEIYLFEIIRDDLEINYNVNSRKIVYNTEPLKLPVEINVNEDFILTDGKGKIINWDENSTNRDIKEFDKDFDKYYIRQHKNDELELISKNPDDYVNLQPIEYNIGFINTSGNQLWAKIETSNLKEQLYFYLPHGFISYCLKVNLKKEFLVYICENPLMKNGKTYKVVSSTNYLISDSSTLQIIPIGDGKINEVSENFHDLVKYIDDGFSKKLEKIMIYPCPFDENIFGKNYMDYFEIRLNTNQFGNLDIIRIWENETVYRDPVPFTRLPGKYKLEVFRIKRTYKGDVYELETGKSYIFDHKRELYDYNTKEKIPKSKLSFYSNDINDDSIDINYDDPNFQNKDIVYFQQQVPNFVKDENFIDTYFPPENRTISSKDQEGQRIISPFETVGNLDKKQKKIGLFDNIEISNDDIGYIFLRPNEIFKGENYDVFVNRIEPGDVNQGSIGDCWAMSAIAALSLREDLIQNIFKTKKKNSKGFYELYYYDANGNKKLMFLDDYFLCKYGKPLFAHSKENEIWPMLMEKSLAKYTSGYSNLNGGSNANSLKFWTGKPVVSIFPWEIDESWTYILEAVGKGYIITAGSIQEEGKSDNDTKNGIHYGHSYSILDAREHPQNNLRLLVMRNPWGQGEWQGDYSDNSPLWNNEIKIFFKYDICVSENGIFFMKYEDFITHFVTVDIAQSERV